MALPGEIGWIGKSCPDHRSVKLVTRIMQSHAGFFIATQCPQCSLMDPSPHSRETGYYPSREAVEEAVNSGTVDWRDTMFRPDRMEILGF